MNKLLKFFPIVIFSFFILVGCSVEIKTTKDKTVLNKKNATKEEQLPITGKASKKKKSEDASQLIYPVTLKNYKPFIKTKDKLVMLDYWAVWCIPCHMLDPIVKSVAKKNKSFLKVGKVDMDKDPKLVQWMGVEAFPTLQFFKKGKMVHEIKGTLSEGALQEVINKLKGK